MVWAVVVVVKEMLCTNSKVRLLAHDDLTWNNNLSYAIPPDIVFYGILVSLVEPWTPHRIIR